MGRKYLGRHLCIITSDKKAKKGNNGVVIIAHGGQIPTGQKFDLDGGTVYFYCPDGDSLVTSDRQFLKEWAGNKWYSKVVSTGATKCPDYALGKSISYHTGDDVAHLGTRGVDRLIADDPAKAKQKDLINYDIIDSLVTSGKCPYDVVSIRNRKFSPETTLSYVIRKLKQEGYGYGEFHCCFCRAGANAGDWSVRLQQHV